jgi:hypothetical protein
MDESSFGYRCGIREFHAMPRNRGERADWQERAARLVFAGNITGQKHAHARICHAMDGRIRGEGNSHGTVTGGFALAQSATIGGNVIKCHTHPSRTGANRHPSTAHGMEWDLL